MVGWKIGFIITIVIPIVTNVISTINTINTNITILITTITTVTNVITIVITQYLANATVNGIYVPVEFAVVDMNDLAIVFDTCF